MNHWRWMMLAFVLCPALASGQFSEPAILDNFNRANQQPPSGDWSNTLIFGDGGLGVTTNQLARAGGLGISSSYWDTAVFGPDTNLAITASDFTGTAGEFVELWVRAIQPGIGISASGYICRFYAFENRVRLMRMTNSAPTAIVADNLSVDFVNGDRLAISAIGNTMSCWVDKGSGWGNGTVVGTPLLTGTDTTYPSAGYVAIRMQAAGTLFFDDLRVATHAGGSPPAPVLTVNRATTYQTVTGWAVHSYAFDEIPPADTSYWNTLVDGVVNDFGLTRIGMPVNAGAENPTDHWAAFKTCMANPPVDQATCRNTFRGCRYASVNDNADPNSLNAAGFLWGNINDYMPKWTAFRNAVLATGKTPMMALNYAFVSNQINCGGLGNVQATPAEMAEFILAVFQEFNTELGWTPPLIELKNEPDLNATPWEQGSGVLFGQMLAAVGAKLDAAGFPGVKFTVPSPTNAGNTITYYNNIIAQDAGNAARIQDISYHCYGNSCTAPTMANILALQQSTGKTTGMNEWWVGGMDWKIMHMHIKHVNNGYFDIGTLCDAPGAPQKLYICDMSTTPPTITLASNQNFTRHYTRYILPGHVRVAATSNSGILDAIAFAHASLGDRVVSVVNTPTTFTVAGLNAGTYGRRFTSLDLTDVHVDLGNTTITAGQSVSVTLTKPGVVTIWDTAAAPPTDTQPPGRSGGGPSGNLTPGTTTANLVLTTDENATCKYGTVPDTAYASIANTFSTTGGTSHSQGLTGLTNGTTYTYYVRCTDAATVPNVNTNDLVIMFSVLMVPPEIYLSVDYETGNFAQWTTGGGATNLGGAGSSTSSNTIITSSPTPHGGTYAARHQVLTPDSNDYSANTIRWNFGPSVGNNILSDQSAHEAYFSAWFYFPTTGGFNTTHWHNLMQWKTDSNNWSVPIMYLQPVTRGGIFQIEIWHWACRTGGTHPNVTCVDFPGYGPTPGFYQQASPLAIPRDQWVHLEAYYRAQRTDGAIQVWQNGTEIFNLTAANFNTLDANNAGVNGVTYNCADPGALQTCYNGVQWGIGVYFDFAAGEDHTAFTDDVIVSSYPVHTIGGSPVLEQAAWCIREANALEAQPCTYPPGTTGRVVIDQKAIVRTALANTSTTDSTVQQGYRLYCCDLADCDTGVDWWAVDEDCTIDKLCYGTNSQRPLGDTTQSKLTVASSSFTPGGKSYEEGDPRTDTVSLGVSKHIEREHSLQVRSDISVGTTFACCERHADGTELDSCTGAQQATIRVVHPFAYR